MRKGLNSDRFFASAKAYMHPDEPPPNGNGPQ
jgi:hypothetical protein